MEAITFPVLVQYLSKMMAGEVLQVVGLRSNALEGAHLIHVECSARLRDR